MTMKRNIILIIALAACLCGCAKQGKTGTNDAAKRYFDSWMQVHFPDAYKKGPSFPGYYVVADTPGKGERIGDYDDSLFVRVNYTLRDLDGTISGTTLASVSKQLGSYSETTCYVPEVWHIGSMASGLKHLVTKTNVGEKVTAVIPGWLTSYNDYETAQEYLDKESGEDGIYELEIVEKIHKNIYEWEIDSICRYIARHYPDKFSPDPALVRPDSVSTHGLYYIQLKAPKTSQPLPGDSTVYINYTGRLLNGQVFDTTIRDTAMRYGIFSSGKSYGPMVANLSTDYKNVTLGEDSNEVVSGFSRTLSQMNAYEKGIGIFCSFNGYDYNGSGKSIPPYSPLLFEIELVDEP